MVCVSLKQLSLLTCVEFVSLHSQPEAENLKRYANDTISIRKDLKWLKDANIMQTDCARFLCPRGKSLFCSSVVGMPLFFPSKCKMVLGKHFPCSFIVLALPRVQSLDEFAASALLRCTPSLSNQEYQYQTILSSASLRYGMRMQYAFSLWTGLNWKCLVSTRDSTEPLQCRWKPRLDPRSSLMHPNLDATERLFTSLLLCSQVSYNCFFFIFLTNHFPERLSIQLG